MEQHIAKKCKIKSRKLGGHLKHAFLILGLGRIWEKSGKAVCWGPISTDVLLALRALSNYLYMCEEMSPACESHETEYVWITRNNSLAVFSKWLPLWLITWNATTALSAVATFGSCLRGIWQNSDRPFCNGGAVLQSGSCFVKWQQVYLVHLRQFLLWCRIM